MRCAHCVSVCAARASIEVGCTAGPNQRQPQKAITKARKMVAAKVAAVPAARSATGYDGAAAVRSRSKTLPYNRRGYNVQSDSNAAGPECAQVGCATAAP